MLSCKDDTVKKENVIKNVPVTEQTYKGMEVTFPFSETTKIEVLSYPMRMMWDRFEENGKERINEKLVTDKKLSLTDTSKIKERVFLDKTQKARLYNLIFVQKFEPDTEVTGCWSPRHLILFYNENEEIIAHIELCLECVRWEPSENINDLRGMTSYQGKLIGDIFKEAGIKYFSEAD